MTTEEQKTDSSVVPFRPRQGAGAYLRRWNATRGEPDTPVEDLARYEAGDDNDDFRHRMTVNLIALGFTGLLIAAGIWIVITLADTRKNQDCFLSGRRNCDAIAAPPMERY